MVFISDSDNIRSNEDKNIYINKYSQFWKLVVPQAFADMKIKIFLIFEIL